jgi:hypothetical protein
MLETRVARGWGRLDRLIQKGVTAMPMPAPRQDQRLLVDRHAQGVIHIRVTRPHHSGEGRFFIRAGELQSIKKIDAKKSKLYQHINILYDLKHDHLVQW